MKTRASYVDMLVGHTSLTRSGAAHVLRHWRALGYKVGRYPYAQRKRQYYLGADHIASRMAVFC